jgi:hypothetical protein
MSGPTLLGIATDAKTVKSVDKGVLIGILYLAPVDISGYQVCPKATAGCSAACLYTAGKGAYPRVQQARIRKTKYFFEDRANFMAEIVADIEILIKRAAKKNLIPAVRLNGTSDIPWEKFPVIRNGQVYRNVMEAFSDIQFYDYSKILNRKSAIAIPNYHITFSLAEDNDADARKAIESGFNVAVVLRIKRSAEKPETWGGYPVINGDDSDIRFNDPKGGHIIALTAKGKAVRDTSGFVREIDAGFISNKQIPIRIAA